MAKKIAKIEVIKSGSNPDVDSDFHTEHREKAIEHVQEIYGKDNVANIVTFGTLAGKAAFKQMSTIYEANFAQANKITSLYPPMIEGVTATLDDIYNPDSDRYGEGADFREAVSGENWQKIIEGARNIEGRNKSTGVHACFVAGTLIKTLDGYKEIENIELGDYVLTHTNTYKEVVDTMTTEDGEIFYLQAANSIPSKVTGNHPFYTRSIIRNPNKTRKLSEPVWKTVDELSVNDDLIGIPVNQDSKIPDSDLNLPFEDPSFWWVAGRFLGDGWCEEFDSIRNRKRKDGTPYEYKRQERNLVISVGYNDPTHDYLIEAIEKNFKYRISPNRTTNKVYIHGDDVFEYFKKFGKYAVNKEVPDEVLSLPIELLKSFVEGYLSADGHYEVSNGYQSFSTVSKKLTLSMIAAINKVYKTHCSVAVSKRDQMVIEGRTVNCHDKYTVSFKEGRTSKLRSFYEDGYIWAGLAKIEKTDDEELTYNFSVLDDNSYVANGLIAHNCGIVMSSVPLSDAIPLHVRQSDQRTITQWTYPECESLGLIKMDFLGLDTVDLIQNTVSNIIKNGKTPPNMIDIIHGEMDDPAVYKLFQEGHTTGIFQFGSEMVRNLLLLTKPTEFADLPAITSVARPGPMRMQSHTKYADRKNGREEIDYIHPEFKGTVMEEILGKTRGLVIYQEQVQQISNRVAGMTLQEGDDLRRAMGKKKQKVMDAMRPKFFEGAMANGFSEEAVTTLWNTLEPFAKYGFNKCLYGRTLVSLASGKGKISIENLYEKFINGEKDIEILSMFEDGEIRPHKVKNIVQTGVKPLYKIKTKSGRIIRLTKEHRLLTPDGYGTIEDGVLKVGKELIIDGEWTKRLSDETRLTRQKTMSKVNKTDEQREKARERMIAYQQTLSFEDRSAHQKLIQLNNPQRSEKPLQAMKEKLKHLRENDLEWQKKVLENSQRWLEVSAGTRKGYGIPTVLSDGRITDSIAEAAAAEYLISRGIDFEMHKTFTSVHGTAKITDFYVNGLYFEMDGLRRGREYFVKEKYGNDIPFVYLTPTNFGDEIDNALISHHIENGDEIVEIIEPKTLKNGSILREMTYDIEMDTTGPANFIANGIVSHNSHAVAYAMNSYQSAYLKTHYPVEFMAALIAQHVDDKDKTLDHLREASRMGLKVSTVDINLSDVKVSPNYSKKDNHTTDIFYGLAGVKAVSSTMAEIIIKERENNGQYSSVKDVIDRCYTLGVRNKKIYESLALVGAFDNFGVSRKKVFESLPQLLDSAKTDENKGDSLFDMFEVSDDSLEIDLTGDDYSFLDRLKKEADTIGLYLSAHPTDKVGQLTNSEQYMKLNKLMNSSRTTTTTVIGSLLDIQVKRSRSGAKSMILNIDDGTEFLTANVAKPIVQGVDKTAAQEKIRKVYEEGKGEIKTEVLTAATNIDVQNVPELEKYGLYVMNITFRPGRDDSPYGARINWIRPLQLTDDGSLPIRIRFKKTSTNGEKMEKLNKILAPNLGKKMPGESSIYTVMYSEEDLMKNDEALYMVAFDIIQKNSSTPHEWPPKLPSSAKNNERILSNEEMILAIENLPYQNSGYKTEKSQKVEQAIEKFVGYGAYDFGVFNPNSLDND